tara:strand:+ start:1658 stop:2233 length:576 start_codon:yes stop_codon:yes gene_type:complete
MKKKLRCLFLGYDSKKTKIISALKKKKFAVKHFNGNLNKLDLKEFDLCVSFGYRKIIDKKHLLSFKRKPLNLHLSYLPFNRGAHPVFWSFIDNTPSGVTIHEINSKLDKGRILFQKKVKINKKKNTFKKAYKIHFKQIESLFIRNITKIISRNYVTKKQIGKGSFHYTADLPNSIKSWDLNINNFLISMKK